MEQMEVLLRLEFLEVCGTECSEFSSKLSENSLEISAMNEFWLKREFFLQNWAMDEFWSKLELLEIYGTNFDWISNF